jgi:cyclic pyranopterin phosphate synthase
MEFSHFDHQGNARMVDVGDKEITERTAVACGTITLSDEAMAAVMGRSLKKGDVFTVAQVAGIAGTKKTSDLIPMCHNIVLSNASVTFETDEDSNTITVFCTARTMSRTGVEMEALTGASIALLTVYDMCKAIDKRMVISNVHLVRKNGGRSGDFTF